MIAKILAAMLLLVFVNEALAIAKPTAAHKTSTCKMVNKKC